MRFIGNRWRKSLLFRVILTTFVLSILLIGATGSALYFQIANGIYKEKTNGSVVEAQSLIQYSQEQLYSTEYIAKIKVKDVIANIVRSTDQTLTSSPRDVVLVGTPVKNQKMACQLLCSKSHPPTRGAIAGAAPKNMVT